MPDNLSSPLNRVEQSLAPLARVALVALPLLLLALLAPASDGTGSTFAHLAYLPVVLAGFILGLRGGLLTGLAAGLLLGPVDALLSGGSGQGPVAWLVPLLSFTLAGALTGYLASRLQARATRLKAAYTGTLRRLADLVAGRDEQVDGHCERIARNAVTVGRSLGLTEVELEALHWAGILHDLGKVAIPDRILQKTGPLSEQEFDLVKTHCAVGADLVSDAGDEFEVVAAGIRTHHERWDGTGYPAGLEAEAVPLSGRILGVVDVFEALTSERPYRKPVGVAAACELLRREAGGHFDPAVVRRFLELYDEGRIEVADSPVAELQLDENA